MNMELIIPVAELGLDDLKFINDIPTKVFKEIYKGDLILYPRDLKELVQAAEDLEVILSEIEAHIMDQDEEIEYNSEDGLEKILELQEYYINNTI